MTIKEAKIYIREELSGFYPENEVSSFIRIIFSDIFNVSSVELISKERNKLKDAEIEVLENTINRLKNDEPLQYIIGHTEFYGLKFHVSPAVLIPRPETEELVDLIVEENNALAASTTSTGSVTDDLTGSVAEIVPEAETFIELAEIVEAGDGLFDRLSDRISEKKPNILDIGTGSGCIAISLAKNLPDAQVFALEISSDALEIAKRNALSNGVKVSFIQGDILCESVSNDVLTKRPTGFDIIVSNPPYVTVSEKQRMEKNVLSFEPETALFVEDGNPLVFYKAITNFAKTQLSENGKLYFEINEQFGNEVKELLLSSGFSDLDVLKDINGRNRFVRGLLRLFRQAQ